MSAAYNLHITTGKYDEDTCAMCDELRKLTYGLNIYTIKSIKICSECYGNIPEHIPVLQDSQYIEAFLRKKL